MLSVSNEILNAFSSYLHGGADIGAFRDRMMELRLEKYESAPFADRAFMDAFEGHYAEFSDAFLPELALKRLLVNFISSSVPVGEANVWLFNENEKSSAAPLIGKVESANPKVNIGLVAAGSSH